MSEQMNVANHLLVAMPSLNQDTFSHAVIYVCEHQPQGAVGLIINQPLQFHLSLIFEQLNIEALREDKSSMPLLFGGPLQMERGFVMHRPLGQWRSSIDLLENEVTVTTSNDIIRAIATDTGPKDVLVALGYVGWGEHQLEQEIMNNNWIVCPYDSSLVYDVPYEERWRAAGLRLGVDMNQLISGAGHA